MNLAASEEAWNESIHEYVRAVHGAYPRMDSYSIAYQSGRVIRHALKHAEQKGAINSYALTTVPSKPMINITVWFHNAISWHASLNVDDIIGPPTHDPIAAYNRAMGILDTRS